MTDYEMGLKEWGRRVARAAQGEARSAFRKGKRRAPVTHLSGRYAGRSEPRLAQSVRSRVVRQRGEPVGVGFNFPVHGIFQEYGVGRGNPRGRTVRSAHQWFTLQLEEAAPRLADLAAEYHAGMVLRVF